MWPTKLWTLNTPPFQLRFASNIKLFGILGVPLSNNPFHKEILGIQTTNPKHQLTINWWLEQAKKTILSPGCFRTDLPIVESKTIILM